MAGRPDPSRRPGQPPKRRPEPQPKPPVQRKPRPIKPDKPKMDPKDLALRIFIAAMILGSIVMIVLCVGLADGSEAPAPQADSSASVDEDLQLGTVPTEKPKKPFWGKDEPEETVQPTQGSTNQVVSTASFMATGDLLIHKSIINQTSAVNQGDKGYNFDSVFKYLSGVTDTVDYAIANLETTLFGPGKPYSGNPKFNTPDEIVDGAKKVGFDMMLTANNHCNDTDLDGVLRTLKVVREKGLATLGTNLNDEETKYAIQDINGIRIGMLCYTYEDSRDPKQVTFNYNPLPAKAQNLVCSFPKFENAKSRDPFYEKLTAKIAEMKEQGAEAIVLFMHWGEEYHLEASPDQKSMAQKLCDMGVDLIVGGHPHVVQPVELLTSSVDPNHKTVCLYSMGNAVSNQRKAEMEKSCPTGHTEDGMLFEFTFEKYADGSVQLGSVDVIPTWVDMHNNAAGKREYNILPLEKDKKDQWETMFGLSPGTVGFLNDSYKRTMDIVSAGLEASNAWLEEARLQRMSA